MKPKRVIVVLGMALVMGAILIGWLSGGRSSARPDPSFYHTPAGVVATIKSQQADLEQALQRRDLEYIHGQMYYLQGLAAALSSKLEGGQKQRVDEALGELKRIAEEIDNFTGRENLEATAASLEKLFESFTAVDTAFRNDQQ